MKFKLLKEDFAGLLGDMAGKLLDGMREDDTVPADIDDYEFIGQITPNANYYIDDVTGIVVIEVAGEYRDEIELKLDKMGKVYEDDYMFEDYKGE